LPSGKKEGKWDRAFKAKKGGKGLLLVLLETKKKNETGLREGKGGKKKWAQLRCKRKIANNRRKKNSK